MQRWFGKIKKADEQAAIPLRTEPAADPLCRALAKQPFAVPAKLHNLRRLVATVNRNGVPSDFVECGTYKGVSSAVIGTGSWEGCREAFCLSQQERLVLECWGKDQAYWIKGQKYNRC